MPQTLKFSRLQKLQRSNSKSTPYTKSKPTSKKSSKQLKYKNKSLIEELDDLILDDLFVSNKFSNNSNNKDIERYDIESQHGEEKLTLDIENTVKELENFAVKE